MDSGSDNTKVTVDIGASASYKSVLSAAIKDFSSFWKSASGGTDAQGAASTFENLANKLGVTTSKGQLVAGVLSGVVAAAAVDVGVKAVKSAAGFQTLTERLVTTAGESQKNLAMVQQGILQVSNATGVAANDAATGMYTVESAGYHGADGLKILTAAAQGAKMEGADVKTVADALTSAMRDYHVPASQAADITSKMITAVSQGKTNFQDFTGALHSVLPLASAAGISFSDVAGSLASMTVHGMSADQAAQNMAEAIRTLQSPSQSMSQYLAQIGINSADLSTKLGKEGLSGTLQDISTAIMQNMGPSGKVLVDAFNKSKAAAQDAQTMFNNLPSSLQNLAKSYENGSMSYTNYLKAEKSLDPQQRNLISQYTSLMNNANGFNNLLKSGSPAALSYSQALQKATGNATTMNVGLMLTGQNANYTNTAVQAVGKAHADAGNKVKGWGDYQKTFNAQLDEAKSSLHNATIAIGLGLLPAVTKIAKVIADILIPISSWISKHQTLTAIILTAIGVFATVVASILLISKAINGVTTAFKILNATFLTNPITLIIAAIIIATVLLLTHWKEVSGWFEAFWSDLKQWASDAWHGIQSAWNDALTFFKNYPKTVLGFYADAGKWLYDVGRNMITGMINGIKSMAGDATKSVKDIGDDAVKGIKGLLGIHSPSTVFAEIGQNMGQGLIQGLQGVQAQANVAVTQLVNGSPVTSGTTPVSSSTTNNHTYEGNSSTITIQQLTIQAPNGATLQSIIQSINQDSINVGKGLAPVGGAY